MSGMRSESRGPTVHMPLGLLHISGKWNAEAGTAVSRGGLHAIYAHLLCEAEARVNIAFGGVTCVTPGWLLVSK